jgi:two-component system, cell cycle response regulator CpdR
LVADTGAATQRPRLRILVAEDDHEMRRLVVDAMRKDGHEVVEASDGRELLIQVTAASKPPGTQFDAVISDIRMPVCSGLAIIEVLRKARWPIPVILMTAFGDEETKARAAEAGALLLHKPFALADLRAAVRTFLPRGP